MSPDLQLNAALMAGKPVANPHAAKNATAAKRAAEDFEAVFINEMLSPMFEGLEADGPFGGGPSEGIFRSMMVDEYAKSLAKQGGFGLSDGVMRTILQAQEPKGSNPP